MKNFDLEKLFKEYPKKTETEIKLYEPISFEKQKELNKKRFLEMKLNWLDSCFYRIEKDFKEIIKMYSELYHKTEYWEEKSTYQFNFNDWNIIRKANGKMTRYYNEFKQLHNKFNKERGEKNEN